MKNIRNLVLVAAFFCCLFPLRGIGGLHAQVTVIDSGYCGAGGGTNLTWKLTSDDILTISGSGDMDDYRYNYPVYYAPWDSYYNTIRTVVIDSGVTSIGNEAFYVSSNNLNSVTFPNSLISIGVRAFAGCTRLNPITLPNSLISIGDMAFSNCYRFTSVAIPAGVTTIGYFAFVGCRILSFINVDSNNQRYSSIDGIVYSKLQDTLILCPQAKGGQVVIPNSVIVIGDNAFSYCENLNSVVIPNSVITIGDEAFTYCGYLNTVIIPNSVTTIGDLAFFDCARFNYIIIPNSVTSIGDWAFYCGNLTFIICNAIIPPASGKNIFGYPPINPSINIPIYIPCLTYNSYSNASGWSQYSNNFVINGNPTPDTTFYAAAMCHDASYTDQNFTMPIYQAGVYYATLANCANCDSIVCLTLTTYPQIPITTYSASICQGESYGFLGETYIVSGIYYETLLNINGCDSIIELTLTVNPTYFTQISDSISTGNSYNFFGKLLTSDGIYYDTLQTIFGCDSVIELTLTITGVGIVETGRAPSLQVYPNPTTGKLTIRHCGLDPQSPAYNALNKGIPAYARMTGERIEIEIFDVLGKRYYPAPSLLEMAGGEVIIDISYLQSEIYFLKINNKIIKVIKQ